MAPLDCAQGQGVGRDADSGLPEIYGRPTRDRPTICRLAGEGTTASAAAAQRLSVLSPAVRREPAFTNPITRIA